METMQMKAPSSTWLRLLATTTLLLTGPAVGADEDGWSRLDANDNFAVWRQPTGEWYVAGDAALDPGNPKALVGTPGKGVMINGKTGRTPSLVTKRNDFRDVELHVEFMVAKGSNSGVIFHDNYEIQILDSHGIEKPTAGHCGGVYPRAEDKPTHHHIDKGSPPKVNAAGPPGKWQTFDIIFQAAQIDSLGQPKDYTPRKTHQEYVDRRMAELNAQQRARIGQLWAEKRRLDPDMPNRGMSFVKIMAYVIDNEIQQGQPESTKGERDEPQIRTYTT